MSNKSPREVVDNQRPHLTYLGAGYLTLFGAAYMDNIRGPILPVLANELAIPYDKVSLFLTVGNVAAIGFTLIMLVAARKASLKKMTLAICLFSGIATAASPLIGGFASLLFFGTLFGGIVAMLGTICNLLIVEGSPENLRSRLLSGGHVMYGIGAFLGPLFAAYFLRSQVHWTAMALLASVLYFLILLYTWSLVPARPVPAEDRTQRLSLEGIEIFAVTILAVYVGAEIMTSMWMVTYLHEHLGLTIVAASPYASAFFLIMAISRLACSIWMRPEHEMTIVWASLTLATVGILLGVAGLPWGLSLVGLLGPFFPVFMSQMNRRFPASWSKMAIWVTIGIQVSLGVSHFSMGILTKAFGAFSIPLFSLTLLMITGVAFLVFSRITAKSLN